MISETFFAANYASVWRTLTPMMDEFVRRTNLDGYERQWTPLVSVTEPARRGLINESAFLLFAEMIISGSKPDNAWIERNVLAVFNRAAAYIDGSPTTSQDELNTTEIKEAVEISMRLYNYFSIYKRNSIEISPHFRGCGILKSCAGDLLIDGSKLYEVKAGDRPFRSLDFRQVLVYVCLHWAETKQIYQSVHLMNPRTGTRVDISVEELASEIAGQPPSELLDRIMQSFSANLVSV